MSYQEFLPPPELQGIIRSCWCYEANDHGTALPGEISGVRDWDRTVPDGCLEVVVHLADPMFRRSLDDATVAEADAILIGQTTQAYFFGWTGHVRMVGAVFHPGAGHLLLDGPVSAFNDQSIELNAALEPSDRRLPIEKLRNTTSITKALRLLLDWLAERLCNRLPRQRDRYLNHACRRITATHGHLDVGMLCRELGISNRYLDRLFQERTGISPKYLARIVRFQSALNLLMPERKTTLSEAALAAGYFDQSHFIRDFRAFTGLAPSAFLRERHPVTRHFLGTEEGSHSYNSLS